MHVIGMLTSVLKDVAGFVVSEWMCKVASLLTFLICFAALLWQLTFPLKAGQDLKSIYWSLLSRADQ